MINENFSIQGTFKFDVFNKDGSLDYSSDDIPNFITPTGLSNIDKFSFADSFRYLSIGTGTGPNTILGLGTTGLSGKINDSGFNYIGGNRLEVCSNNVSNHYGSGAGYLVTDSGVKLFRSWRIPVSNSDFFTGAYNFKEYMLSAGAPRQTGYTLSGSTYILSGICSCNQSVATNSDGTVPIYGPESHDFYLAYPNICEADKAFTRILKNVSVIADQFLVVNYALNIGIDTGVKYFGLSPVRNNPYSGVSGEGYLNWSGISGRNSIVHPGVKLICDNTIVSVQSPTQINTSFILRYGESFIPPLGIPMEPSCPLSKRIAYLSNDNLEFLINESGGYRLANTTGLYRPWNPAGRPIPNGLMRFHKDWITETSSSPYTTLGTIFSSAGNGINPIRFSKPRSELNPVSYYAKPALLSGAASNFCTDFSGCYFTPTTLFPPPNGISDSLDAYTLSGRARSKTLSFQFVDPNLLNRFPVRAMVIGYYDTYYFPGVDVLFLPLSGAYFVADPTVNWTGNPGTYSKLMDKLYYDSGLVPTGYSYMDENNLLQFQFKINWSSPCDSNVIGC